MMNEALFAYDEAVRTECGVLCGVDEAGRGPLCGPVCAGAVILRAGDVIEGVNDSKKLSEKKREALFDVICARAVCWNVALVGPEVIDEINILNAAMLAMKQAVEGLAQRPGLVLVDGNRCPKLEVPVRSVVKGDAASASIAAASILAKVTRDRYMRQLAQEYPQYELDVHKGYPTKRHYELLDQYGIQPFYRKSFLKKRGYV